MKGVPARWFLALLPLLAAVTVAQDTPTLEQIVARHIEARGGAERWQEVTSIELTGIYAAFSDHEPFRLVRSPGNLYRLDFKILGAEAVRARDAEGPWWIHGLLQPQAGRAAEEPYKSQIERESLFGPLLLDLSEKGLEIELVGPADIEGIATIELAVSLPGGQKESWFLDAETYLEVAVDSEVSDYTQSPQPMKQRAFYDDFREVNGVQIPFRLDYEFGHRLESMTVEEAVVDGEVDPSRFSPPAAAPAEE
jgi:hypothetical protein